MPDSPTTSVQVVSGSSLPDDPNSVISTLGTLSGVPMNNNGFCRIVDIDPSSVPGAVDVGTAQIPQTNANNPYSDIKASQEGNTNAGGTPAVSTLIAKQYQPKKEYHVPKIETNDAANSWFKKLDDALDRNHPYNQDDGFNLIGENGGNNNKSYTTNDLVKSITMDDFMALIGGGAPGQFNFGTGAGNSIMETSSKITEIANTLLSDKTKNKQDSVDETFLENYGGPNWHTNVIIRYPNSGGLHGRTIRIDTIHKGLHLFND